MTVEHVSVVRTESAPVDSVTPHPSNPRRGDMSRIERARARKWREGRHAGAR